MSTEYYIYCIVSLFAVIVGTIMGLSMVYVGKFKSYIEGRKKNNGNKSIKLLDALWRVSLPIIFGLISLVIPAQIIYLIINIIYEVKVNNLGSLYLVCFVVSFALCMFVLIKTGKIKTTPKKQI